MEHWVRHILLALLVALFCATPLSAHGGTYRGPGSGIGPAGPSGPSTPTGPSPGGPGAGPATGGASDSSGDLTAWQQWWALNRDGYLELKAALARALPVSGADDFFGGGTVTDARIGVAPARHVLRNRIVPALIEILAKERGPDLSTAALLALARIGPVPTDSTGAHKDGSVRSALAIRARLSSDNQEVSESAAIALGILGDTSAATVLVDLLDDTEAGRTFVGRPEVPYRTRAFGAYALGLLGRSSTNGDVTRFVVHHLASALVNDHASARDVQVACVIALGLVPLQDAGRANSSTSPAASRSAQFAFLASWMGDKSRPEVVRVYAPIALVHVAQDDPALRDALVAACCDVLASPTSSSAALSQSAAAALGWIADSDVDALDVRARTALMRQTGDGDRLARRLAWIALARAGSRLGTGGDPERGRSETREFLLDALARGSTPERPWIALALGLFERANVRAGGEPAPRVREALERNLRDHGGPSEAGAYCLALGLSGAPGIARTLLQVLAEAHDDAVRAHAAVALGLARESAGVEPLRAIVLESRFKPVLLRDAAIGLGLLGDRTLGPTLVTMLETAQGLSAQAAIATALGFVGDARAVDPLLTIARDATKSPGPRAFAVVALGLISDRALLPWNACIAADANYWVPPGTLFNPSSGTGVLDIL